jgi:hypothetical protein
MRGVEKGDSMGQVTFFASLFGVAAKLSKQGDLTSLAFLGDFLQHNPIQWDQAQLFNVYSTI